MKIPTEDHLGNSFQSVSDMCTFYGVPLNTYYRRRKKGLTKKESLVTRPRNATKQITDHEGNVYPNLITMCKFYGISTRTYYDRKHKGFSLQECLLGKSKPAPETIFETEPESLEEMELPFGLPDPIKYYTTVDQYNKPYIRLIFKNKKQFDLFMDSMYKVLERAVDLNLTDVELSSFEDVITTLEEYMLPSYGSIVFTSLWSAVAMKAMPVFFAIANNDLSFETTTKKRGK